MIKNLKATLASLVAVSAMVFAGPSIAQDMGFYAGVHIGQSKLEDFCDFFSGPGVSCDDKDTAWRILGGYQFNPNLAFELAYTNFGEASVTGPGGSATVEGTAFELVGVGSLPLANRFSAYAKLGLFRADLEASNTLGESADDSETGLTFGLGLRFDFTRNLGARVEWQRYQEVGDDIDFDLISVGILFRF